MTRDPSCDGEEPLRPGQFLEFGTNRQAEHIHRSRRTSTGVVGVGVRLTQAEIFWAAGSYGADESDSESNGGEPFYLELGRW